jgi:transcription elongation factor Elf1
MIVVKCPKCGGELIDNISYNFSADIISCGNCGVGVYVAIKTIIKKEIKVCLTSADVYKQEPVTIIL